MNTLKSLVNTLFSIDNETEQRCLFNDALTSLEMATFSNGDDKSYVSDIIGNATEIPELRNCEEWGYTFRLGIHSYECDENGTETRKESYVRFEDNKVVLIDETNVNFEVVDSRHYEISYEELEKVLVGFVSYMTKGDTWYESATYFAPDCQFFLDWLLERKEVA